MARKSLAERNRAYTEQRRLMVRQEIKRIVMEHFIKTTGGAIGLWELAAAINPPSGIMVDREVVAQMIDSESFLYEYLPPRSEDTDRFVKPSGFALAHRLQSMESALADVKAAAIKFIG